MFDNQPTIDECADSADADMSGCAQAGKRGLPAGCLFVASLDATKSEDHLQQSVSRHFAHWGRVLHVKVLRDWADRPYAFVQFENINDAEVALKEAHNSWINGRQIRVEKARVNRTLFVAKLNPDHVEEEIRSILEQFGPLEEISIPKNFNTGRNKGCGFVKFCYRDDAIAAFNSLRQTTTYFLEWAENLDKPPFETNEEDTHSIYVGNLNENLITKELLHDRFERYGKIEDIHLVNRGRDYGKPAYAFIRFSEASSAEAAITQENDVEYLERQMKVRRRLTQEYRNFQFELNRQHNEIRRRSAGHHKCSNFLGNRQPVSHMYANTAQYNQGSGSIPSTTFYPPMQIIPPNSSGLSPVSVTPPGSFSERRNSMDGKEEEGVTENARDIVPPPPPMSGVVPIQRPDFHMFPPMPFVQTIDGQLYSVVPYYHESAGTFAM
ncbi:7099_t:CDS:2 [Paraglomus occultum]|uniref:7099_t:CDS:1 n=1 Tax=Paraglomus occultum TaxID=144539 RepID=A0A9N9F0Y6_9GLOM|nr:7099_t:CDS:2 [Paraglomus occultum]